MDRKGSALIVVLVVAVILVAIAAFAVRFILNRRVDLQSQNPPGTLSLSPPAGQSPTIAYPFVAPSSSPTSTPATPTPMCTDTPHYFVIARDRADGLGVGSDILIKYKINGAQTFACVYSPTTQDFELKGLDGGYFLGIADHFLVLDFGTGPPPRILEVDDLNTRKKVFGDKYSEPISINDASINYWSPTNIIATALNCPDLGQYSSDGFGVEIEAQVALDLSTMAKTESKNYRCSPTQ